MKEPPGQPRIAPLEPPYEPQVAETLRRMMPPDVEPLRLFRTVAHNPAVLERFRTIGAYILNFGRVEPLDREVLLHRTCARCGCEYEWGVHAVAFGRPLGMTEEQLRATVLDGSDAPVWSERQRLLVRLADELARHGHGLGRALGRARAALGRRAAARADRDRRLLPPGVFHGECRRRRARAVRGAVPGGDAVEPGERIAFPPCVASSLGLLVLLAAALAVNTVVTDRDTEDAKADVGRIVDLPEGDLQVREDGPADGQAVVLLHGFACSLGWWDQVAPALARDHRVIRFDLLGHGGSEKPKHGYGMESQARLVAAALDRLGVRRAAVVGHSMGGSVATALAEQRPALVESLGDPRLALEERRRRAAVHGPARLRAGAR